ncbi:chromate efflux transporter [Pedobacter sp. MC2016-14]|uniref:chromate efflux transporter n=1 Tax=Pedobacter sp. MC2016-14 TaxID=2897327 RepID=UPI001E36A33A|nr:chromate efflux transporter [Pedobacter sp. MC2016-14]MCD0490540.1 chromate efflux transporter [Pedobacter sp. MC2016-14]
MISTMQDSAIEKQTGLSYLFFTFLKIGCISFGGHMALIAVVEKEMIERDGRLTREDLLNAVSIASLLPGPLAVNVVAYIGYHLQLKSGLAISMFAVLLPACILMYVLSWCYFNYMHVQGLSDIMVYTVAAVSAIILSTGLNLFFKEVKSDKVKLVLCLASIALLYFVKGYLIIVLLMLIGGLTGMFFNLGNQNAENATSFKWQKLSLSGKAGLSTLVLLYVSFISGAYKYTEIVFLKITAVFSGVSLSLFGGGYVMIPIMQSLFVTELKWLTNQEFIDSIAFSQLTPGPILVSAFFTGYKLAGVAGAILATLAIFLPSAMLMVMAAKIFRENVNSARVKNAMSGIKPVVIGMILVSALKLFFSVAYTPFSIALFFIAFILSFRFKFNPAYLILISLMAGVWFHFN